MHTYRNIVLIPFHGKDTTSLGVEIWSIGSSAPLCYPTTSIAVYKRVAICMILAIARLSEKRKNWNRHS